MRMAIASPGNDFRLGACEAPPAIISMYLGNDLSEYLESYIGMCLYFGFRRPLVRCVLLTSVGLNH